MNFDTGSDTTLQSYSGSDIYPAALEDGDSCSTTINPSDYWTDDSWQWSMWPTTDAFGSTGLADMSSDSFLACSAVYPVEAAPDYNDTSFVYPEQLQLAANDCYPVAQPASEVQIENTQPHDCQRAQVLEERINSLEKLLSSRETE